MIDVPPEVRIKSTIKSGSVYYFAEETLTSDEPHYFVVINHNPITDNVILLVCASSKIERVKKRRSDLPMTVVEVKKEEYDGFKKDSIIDCNDVLKKPINQLIQKLEEGKLELKPIMDIELVNKLRKAILQSPVVERYVKKLLT